MKRIICWIFGHDYQKTEGWRELSKGVRYSWKDFHWHCQRCGKWTEILPKSN